MKIADLIKQLEEHRAKHGDDLPVLINDTHANTSDVGKLEYFRYSSPTLVIYTE